MTFALSNKLSPFPRLKLFKKIHMNWLPNWLETVWLIRPRRCFCFLCSVIWRKNKMFHWGLKAMHKVLTWSFNSINCFERFPTSSWVFSSWVWRHFTSNWSPSPSAVSKDVARKRGNLRNCFSYKLRQQISKLTSRESSLSPFRAHSFPVQWIQSDLSL